MLLCTVSINLDSWIPNEVGTICTGTCSSCYRCTIQEGYHQPTITKAYKSQRTAVVLGIPISATHQWHRRQVAAKWWVVQCCGSTSGEDPQPDAVAAPVQAHQFHFCLYNQTMLDFQNNWTEPRDMYYKFVPAAHWKNHLEREVLDKLCTSCGGNDWCHQTSWIYPPCCAQGSSQSQTKGQCQRFWSWSWPWKGNFCTALGEVWAQLALGLDDRWYHLSIGMTSFYQRQSLQSGLEQPLNLTGPGQQVGGITSKSVRKMTELTCWQLEFRDGTQPKINPQWTLPIQNWWCGFATPQALSNFKVVRRCFIAQRHS